MFAPSFNSVSLNSAPKVRTYNMYKSLSKIADVELIPGRLPNRIFNELQFITKDFDYVYFEAMGLSMQKTDYCFFNYLKKKNIPFFPFIRDLYYQYDGTLKKTIPTKIFHYASKIEFEWHLKNATAMFFPSQEMANTVNFPDKYLLPPAGDLHRCNNYELPNNQNIIYVGGISQKMGIDLLVKAMGIVVKKHPDAHCIIIGHGDEEIINKFIDFEFITFKNASYNELNNILSLAQITVIPLPKIPHNDFAIPVKIFDYMSFAKPIVATNCTSMANFINSNEIGITTNDNPQDFAHGILKMLDDLNLAERCGQNSISLIKNGNSWDDRAKSLLNIMKKY